MTRIDGLTLTDAEHAISEAHPGFRVWHSRDGENTGRIYATTTATDPKDTLPSGTTLDAPSVERIEEVIGVWEHQHQGRAA